MEDLEKIKRHLAKPVPIKITNSDGCEDTFYLKPLNIEQQSMMVGLSKKFQGKSKEELKSIDKEDFTEMQNLIKDVVKNSLDLEDPMLEEFVVSNFDVLSEKLGDLLPQVRSSKGSIIKKELEEARNAKKGQPKE